MARHDHGGDHPKTAAAAPPPLDVPTATVDAEGVTVDIVIAGTSQPVSTTVRFADHPELRTAVQVAKAAAIAAALSDLPRLLGQIQACHTAAIALSSELDGAAKEDISTEVRAALRERVTAILTASGGVPAATTEPGTEEGR